MKQILLMIAMVALVGCGKKEIKVIETEGDRQTVKQSVTQNAATDLSTIEAQTGRLIAAKLSEEIVTVAKKPSLVIKDFKGEKGKWVDV